MNATVTRLGTAAAVVTLMAALAGCSGGTTAGKSAPSTPTTTAASPSTAEAASPSTAAAASPSTNAPVAAQATPAPSTCPEFSMTAAHMATNWDYLSINLGTTNDEGPTLATLQSGAKALTDLAPKCAPQAVKAIGDFEASVLALVPVYTTKPTGAQVKAVNDALTSTQKAGAEMFTALGMATYAWE